MAEGRGATSGGKIIWKPYSDGGLNPGGLSVILPGNAQTVQVVGPNGEVLETLRGSGAGHEGYKFYSRRGGGAFGQSVRIRVDGKEFNIPNGGQRYEGSFSGDGNLAPVNKGMQSGPGGGTVGIGNTGQPNPTPYTRYQFGPNDAQVGSFGAAGTGPGAAGQQVENILNATRSGTQFNGSPFTVRATGAASLAYISQALQNSGVASPQALLNYLRIASTPQAPTDISIGSGAIALGLGGAEYPQAFTGNTQIPTGLGWGAGFSPQQINALVQSGAISESEGAAMTASSSQGGAQPTEGQRQAGAAVAGVTRRAPGTGGGETNVNSTQPTTAEGAAQAQGINTGDAANNVGSATGTNVVPTPDGGGFVNPQSLNYNALGFSPVVTPEIPNIQTPFVDPLLSTARTGNFNTDRYQAGFQLAQDNALQLLGTELAGNATYAQGMGSVARNQISQDNVFNALQLGMANLVNREFTRASNVENFSQLPTINAIDRNQISGANTFNQRELTRGIDSAIPGYRDTINTNLDRAETYASGRLLTTADDRAYELTARSAAADSNFQRGFGDDSVFGRKTSDLLSAEQRLGLSQSGMQMSNQWLSTAYNSLFSQPVRQTPLQARDVFRPDTPALMNPQQSQVGSQINVNPTFSPGQAAASQAQILGGMNTIDPTAAFSAQSGFNTQNTGMAINRVNNLAQLDYGAQGINSGRQYDQQLTQISGQIADVRNIEAAAQGGLNSYSAYIQQQVAAQIYRDYLQRVQANNTMNDLFSLGAQGFTVAANMFNPGGALPGLPSGGFF